MSDPIYKTVAFRKPKSATISLPLLSAVPINRIEPIEKKLKAVADIGWQRPTNDELLGYLAARMEKAKPFVANGIDAIAIALLKRTDMSVSRQVFQEAHAIEGAKIVLAPLSPQRVLDDLIETMDRGTLSGIHGDKYLQKVKEAANEWLETKPENEKEVKPKLRQLIGESILLRRGVREGGNAEYEFSRIRIPDALWYKEATTHSKCDSVAFLDILIKNGIPSEKACMILIKALQNSRAHFHKEESRSEIKVTISDQTGKSSSIPFKQSNSLVQHASRVSVLVHQDFKTIKLAAIEGWKKVAPDGLENLLEYYLEKSKNSKERFLQILDEEIKCLEQYCMTHHAGGGTDGSQIRKTKPCVASFGIGDLFVVEEEWLGNVAREVSYIENARGGESRVRIHEQETEEIVYEETERITEESKSDSHQTADRFELQSTVASQTTMALGVNANVNVSGTYGVTTVQTSAGATFGFSRTESASMTTTKARETVAKATTEIRNNVREKLTKTLRERTLSRNEHRFEAIIDNSSVFRFVEKKYRVQVKQYGARLFLEFIVPEPGRTLLSRKAAEVGLEPFTLKPNDIYYDPVLTSISTGYHESAFVSAWHYARLAAKYDARGIEPPPRPMTLDCGMTIDITETYGTAEKEIKVPDGYRSSDFMLAASYPLYGFFSVAANGRNLYTYYAGTKTWGELPPLAGPAGDPGFIVTAYMQTAYGFAPKFKGNVNVALIIDPTNDRLHKWRMETWLRLREGYLNQLAEAEAKLEEKMSGMSIEDPPARLREKERNELQRSILCLLTGTTPDYSMVTNANIESDVYIFFQPKGCQRKNQTKISFFDGAFEWHDMITFYMPFHFSERDTWTDRLNLRTVDEKHRQFLSAGAARVMLPVTPGHEAKVLAFLETPISLQQSFFDQLEAENNDATFADGLPDFSTNILREILCERNDQYRLGAGTLVLDGNNFKVNPETDLEQLAWVLDERIDIGREVMINGKQYVVTTVASDNQGTFSEDTGYYGIEVQYYLGGVPIGDPWIEFVPTPLIILGGQEYKLGEVKSEKEQLDQLESVAANDAALQKSVNDISSETKSGKQETKENIAKRQYMLTGLENLEGEQLKRVKAAHKRSEEIINELQKRSSKRGELLEELIKQQKALNES